jgi:hypothetical protein
MRAAYRAVLARLVPLFGAILLAGLIICAVLLTVLAVAQGILGSAAASLLGGLLGSLGSATTGMLVSGLGMLVVNLLFFPLAANALTLLYLGLRAREAL